MPCHVSIFDYTSMSPMFKICAHCDFKTLLMDDFIPHFKKEHYNDLIKIGIPLYYIGNKCKYSVMNYQTRLSYINHCHLKFDAQLNLNDVSSPKAKQIKMISTPTKELNIQSDTLTFHNSTIKIFPMINDLKMMHKQKVTFHCSHRYTNTIKV